MLMMLLCLPPLIYNTILAENATCQGDNIDNDSAAAAFLEV